MASTNQKTEVGTAAQVDAKPTQQNAAPSTLPTPTQPATTQHTPVEKTVEELQKEEQQKTKERIGSLEDTDREAVELIAGLIEEYAAKVSRASDLGDSAQGNYGKLHGAFRSMMALRGKAHIEAARLFMAALKKHHKGCMDYDMRCRHLNLLSSESRSVFTGYLDLLSRFARSENKGGFRSANDIDRILNKVNDPALAESMNAVFP